MSPRAPRILIVDDTPENLDVLGELLANTGQIFVALDGYRALELASASPPDLILLDVMMPGMDGYEVCRRLHADAATAKIPVVFVTTQGAANEEMRGFKVGAVDYIHKPFNPALVRRRVETQLQLKAARDAVENQNVLLEGLVDERTAELRAALDTIRANSLETIVRLSRAAEFKDDDTGAHVLRMSRYSALIGRELGMSPAEADDLLHAAPMHDIGKIGIPDRILLKPGKLDADEWVVMRRHAEMGAEILSGSDSAVIQLGEQIASSHHEKWDGSGYPSGLRGEEIPLAGRIVAVADVFDALTSRRPYKEPFTVERSLSILREGRGTHFDPTVLDAFFGALDEILLIKENHQEEGESWLRSVAGASAPS